MTTNFKGKGEHSIIELENMILEKDEQLLKKQLCIQDFLKALEIVSNWELPNTAKFWDDDIERPVSYGTEYGSNGERDFIKQIASNVIEKYS